MKIIQLERYENENNKDYIYRCLRESIIRSTIKPGEAISEPMLQQFFNVSRSPIREAISILSHEGLLDVQPQKKTRIVLIDSQQVIESRYMRYCCERETLIQICKTKDTQLLANNLDKLLDEVEECIKSQPDDLNYKLSFEYDSKFHSMIFEYYGLPLMWKMLRLDNVQYNRFLCLYLQTKMRNEAFVRDHREIAKMIRTKNIDGLVKQTKRNFDQIAVYLGELVQMHPDYFKQV